MSDESLGTTCTECGCTGPLDWFDVGGSDDERGTLWCNDCGAEFVAEIFDVQHVSQGLWTRVP